MSWRTVALGELAITDGQYGLGAPSRELREGDPRYVRITDIRDTGLLHGHTVAPDCEPNVWEKALLREGDLLFARSGATVGKTYLHPASQLPAVYAGYLIRFQLDTRCAFPRYVFHYTRSAAYHDWVALSQRAVAQPNINAKQYAELPVPLPPLDEQRRIAAILDRADDLRAKRSAVLPTLEEFRRALFSDVLEDQSSQPHKLGDLAEVVTGFAFKSAEYATGAGEAVKLCRGANVLPGRLDWSDLARWPKATEGQFDRFRLVAGDIVVAMDRPWIGEGFKIARATEADCPSLLVQRVARIRANNKANNEFLYAALDSPLFQRHCRPTETTVPHISPVELKNFVINVPSADPLERFAYLSRQVDDLRAGSLRASDQADELFAALQSRAFSGQL